MALSANMRAFLDTLAWSEGTDRAGQKTNDRGYDVMVGGKLLIISYKDHPRAVVKLSASLSSSAAGRYQVLQGTYDELKGALKLKDFSPDAQDLIAVEKIRQCKALDDVEAGRFEAAVTKCNKTWASLPGSPYGQRTNSMIDLKNIFLTRKIKYQ